MEVTLALVLLVASFQSLFEPYIGQLSGEASVAQRLSDTLVPIVTLGMPEVSGQGSSPFAMKSGRTHH